MDLDNRGFRCILENHEIDLVSGAVIQSLRKCHDQTKNLKLIFRPKGKSTLENQTKHLNWIMMKHNRVISNPIQTDGIFHFTACKMTNEIGY